MFKRVDTDNLFKQWLETAHLLDTPYDYFSFALLCNENKCITNLYYATLINKIVKEDPPKNRNAINALNLFNKRENMDSSFGNAYSSYWIRHEESEASSQAQKRRLETFLNLNEDTCDDIEAISRNYMTITCPSTPEELITFTKKLPLLFHWKHTIITHAKQMLADDS
ncbi:hypothetical protein BD770DRAFT_405989 [Pilaira anomala]|nr:hypothetical protein BD770DRAFT_405989 [Pilaira anomala]